jgi:hypothetical protein
MKNTYLKLNKNTSDRLLKILEQVSDKEKDTVWRDLHNEVNKICSIWYNIDIRSIHLSKIHAQAQVKNKNRPSYIKE